MRKLNVENYIVTVMATGGKTPVPYDVKNSLITCLLHPSLKLNAREVLLRHKIADKIEKADGMLLLEDEEYNKLYSAMNSIEGFGQNDVELIERVFNAETVEVKEKKEG